MSIKIEYSRTFQKQFAKLSPKVREQFKERQRLWVEDPYHPQLRLHKPAGEFAGFYSINITGDVRAIYEKSGQETVVFGLIGTHSELYG